MKLIKLLWHNYWFNYHLKRANKYIEYTSVLKYHHDMLTYHRDEFRKQ